MREPRWRSGGDMSAHEYTQPSDEKDRCKAVEDGMISLIHASSDSCHQYTYIAEEIGLLIFATSEQRGALSGVLFHVMSWIYDIATMTVTG